MIFRYNPIQKYGPQDCVASINAIVAKADQVIASRNQEAISDLKTVFGLGSLTDIRDFAMTIAFPRMYFTDIFPSDIADTFKSKWEGLWYVAFIYLPSLTPR